MFYLELSIIMQALGIVLVFILLHKTNQQKKQIEDIIKKVGEYLTFIEMDMEQECAPPKQEEFKKRRDEDAQNHLIQSVLKEYFP